MVAGNDSIINSFSTESSEDKFKSLINSVNGFEEFTLDWNGIIISSNLEAVNITGYEEWEVIGKPISIFYPPKEVSDGKVEDDLAKARVHGKHVTSAFRVKKKGSLFFAKMKFTSLRHISDQESFFRVVMFDATHRAMFAVNSRRIKEEYFSLFNNSFVGIFKFRTKDFAFTLLNEKALQIIHRDRGHLKISQVFYEATEFVEFHEKLESEKAVNNFEFRLNVAGEERYGSISCKYFAYRGVAEGIISDITEKRNQLNQIRKLNAELDNFLYHASHDLRAPLSTILGLTYLIKTDDKRQHQVDYAEKIGERVRFMDCLLKDLSHIAFNNSQEVKSDLIRFDTLIPEILKPLNTEYPFVKCSTDIRVKRNFYNDPKRVQIILNNIICNAYKYHRHNTPQQLVHIRIECLDDCVIVQVEDNGCGIEAGYLGDIFKLFFKANARGKGSGLGLYVAQIMLQALKGKIDVVSKVNAGSCFTFSIPNIGKQLSLNSPS
jgi:PAS domain S-box-containing protein